MTAIILDTLKYSQALKDADADKKLADAIATGLGSTDTTSFATKDDIADLKREVARVRSEIADLRSDLNTGIADVKTEIAHLRSDLNTGIANVNTRLSNQFRAQTFVFVLVMVPIFIAIYQN